MARPAPRQRLTFQDNALLDPARQAGLLNQAYRQGFRGLQQDVVWGDVYKNGAYDWSKFDTLVNNARARGFNPAMTTFRLYGTPATMAHGRDTTLSANNPNAALAGKFAEAVAQHFKGRVGKYGIWNEPNVPSFLNREAGVAARDYRAIYQKMRSSIHGADLGAKIGFGEITSQQPNTPGAMSTIGFLKAVLAAGNKPLRADYVAIHPYQWSNPNTKPGNAWYGGISNLKAVQAEIAKQARAGKLVTAKGKRPQLVLSEFGYKHDAQSNAGTRAAWMKRSLELAQEAGVRDVNLYQLVPSRAGSYWDSSIANSQGVISPRMRRVLSDIRRGRR